jgi:hypothetical protein
MQPDGVFLVIIPTLLRLGALGTKVVTVAEDNRRRELPATYATYLLTDPATGTCLALMTESFLTAGCDLGARHPPPGAVRLAGDCFLRRRRAGSPTNSAAHRSENLPRKSRHF